MIRTLIESPFAGDVAAHVRYLRFAIRDSLARDEAPFASHGFFPQVLDDDDPAQRALGMLAGFVWGGQAQRVAVYLDLGFSPGMREGVKLWHERGIEVVPRRLYCSCGSKYEPRSYPVLYRACLARCTGGVYRQNRRDVELLAP